MPTGGGGGGGVVGMKKLKEEEPRVNIMERESERKEDRGRERREQG